ncbi:MAG: hypothetical protein QOG99_3258 [Frankiales bacterium]|jgi:hypothetical protein|nr:hypothetical protein [Frankiales bacterium]
MESTVPTVRTRRLSLLGAGQPEHDAQHTAWGLPSRVRFGGLLAVTRTGACRGQGVQQVSTSADQTAPRGLAERLGIQEGQVVQVLGDTDDIDDELLDDVAARTTTELIKGDDTDEVVDVVLLWWREGDGDLVDALVDSLTNLGDSGVVWLLTPKAGRDGHVEPSDIDEAAPTAGLSSTRSTSAAPEWSGTRLVSPKAARAKQRR